MTTFGGSLLVPVVAGSLAPTDGMLMLIPTADLTEAGGTSGGRVDVVMARVCGSEKSGRVWKDGLQGQVQGTVVPRWGRTGRMGLESASLPYTYLGRYLPIHSPLSCRHGMYP